MTPKMSPLLLALIGGVVLGPAARASPSIADTPPHFRIYDVDKRERDMKRLIGEMAGTPALSHGAADAALGRLDLIHRREDALRGRNGGRLDVAIIRSVDVQLNTLSRALGLREPAY